MCGVLTEQWIKQEMPGGVWLGEVKFVHHNNIVAKNREIG